MAPLIEVKDLTKVYVMGDVEVHALRGITLSIAEGEMVAIMGPSGSGKSTLMNIIGCLDQPSDGTYMLDGVDVGELSDDELAMIRNQKIGFVFQQYMLLPRTSALRNVELPMLYGKRHNRQQRAKAALEAVGMGERVHHLPNELSGGQQQRVAIARALVNDPRIIMADEPTGALDSKTGAEIMAIFQRLNREQGITVILVTHEADIAQHAQRVIHVRDGTLDHDEIVAHRTIAAAPIPDNGQPAAALHEVPTS
jgi:putative ABC transport system ATP-binding protein